ncbi:lytic replication protein [Escherichia fergusonii]|uniref:lytic replication protein n=1 Tax=Escherichia fergusonii TaxID=564 RepID=UPI002433AB31|nr:lytic replication protein [Escherichia fergusonii]WGA68631.1 lytic replication protein [Escherichia fergusonii]
MSILNSDAITFNIFERKDNAEYHKQIKGHQLSFFARHSGFLSPTHGSIIAEFSNLAGSTDEYIIRRSYADMAAILGRSVSTVRRAFSEAVKCGMLTKQHQIGSNNAQVCNVYRFTPAFLQFIAIVLETGRKQGVKIVNATKLVKELISKVRSFFEVHTPLFKMNNSPRVHDEQPIEKKNKTLTKKRERSCPVQPKASQAVSTKLNPESLGKTHVVSEEQINNCLAAAKARSAKGQADDRHAKRLSLHRAAEKLAHKIAWIRGEGKTVKANKTTNGLEFSMDYSAYQDCQTVDEALKRMKQRGTKTEFDDREWCIPAGFRG